MEREQGLVSLLERLRERFGVQAFEVSDHWVTDLGAIRITRPGVSSRLVYLAVDPDDGSYYIALEEPSERDQSVPRTRAFEFEAGDFAEVAELVREHLRLS